MLQINQQNDVIFDSLLVRQNALIQELADIQKELFELQQKLQNELGGVTFNNITEIVTKNPDFINIVTRKDNIQAIKPITDNSLPSLDGSSPLPQEDETSNRVSELPLVNQDTVVHVFDELESPCASTISDSGICKPLVRCLAFYADIPELRKRPCILREGEFGVCCPFVEKESKLFFFFSTSYK